MKKLILPLIFLLLVLPAMSQLTLSVNGTVYETVTGNPIPNHEVFIQNDSSGWFFYHTVYTNDSGFYADTITLLGGGTQGNLTVSTMDCQNYFHQQIFTYSPNLTNFTADFTICNAVDSCQAGYLYLQQQGLSVQFSDASNGGGTTRFWSFGDGSSSTLMNPVHVYAQPGYYIVSLTIGDLGTTCYDSISSTIYVYPNGNVCHADFSVYPDSTSQYTYNFVNQSTGNLVSWYWNFGDGSTSAQQSPAHTYANAGIYMVCLTVQGADSSCFDTRCDTLYVGNGTGCQAQYSYYPDSLLNTYGVQFIDLSTYSGNPTTWFWSFGDGLYSYLKNPLHYFPSSGTYYVCLTLSSGNCTSTWCSNVTIGDTTGCASYFIYSKAGLSVNFQGFMVNSNPASYQWSFGDGQGGEEQNIIHEYASPGIYYVNLTTMEDSTNCQYSSSTTIMVGDSVEYHQIYGQVFAGNFPITDGLAMLFSVDTTNSSNPFIDISYIDSMGIYYFSMVPAGNYVVYAMPMDSNGYLPTYYGDVLYWEEATIIQAGQAENPCNIHLLTAGNMAAGNGNINGLISNGEQRSGMLDKITMQLMDAGGNMISFDKVNTQGDFIFPSLEFGKYFVHAEIAGITSDVIQVTLSQESPSAIINMTLSGKQIQGISEVPPAFEAGVIYPNPVTELAHLSILTKSSFPVIVELYSMTGKMVYTTGKMAETGETQLSIPVSSLPVGIYTLRIYSDNGTSITRKLLKIQ